jgi:hypothetical protein
MKTATRRRRIAEIAMVRFVPGRGARIPGTKGAGKRNHRGIIMAGKGRSGEGRREHPWRLKSPSRTSEFTAFRDETLDPPALVVKAGSTELRYHLRCIQDLHAMLKAHGDWMELGSADEQKPAKDGTVEAWARSPKNPVGGWYGLKKGLRGRFGMYVPPVLEALGLAEVEHNPKNNRMRAL